MLGKAKIKSKCKGDDTSNVLILDTKKVRRVLANSIPVLSIFALVGILAFSVMLPSNHLTRLFGIDKLFGLDNLLEDSNKAYAEEGITPLTDASASLTVDDGKIKDTIFATSGEFAYASHKVNVAATNIKSYTLTLSKTTGLTGPSTVNDANEVNANDMDNQWGYAWIDETTNPKDDTVKYYAVTDSTTVANNDNIDSSHNVDYSKQLVFGAKFGSSAASGTYHAEATLSLVATPRVVTNYVVNVNCNSGTNCTSTLNTTSDEESYVYTISGTTPTRSGYKFLGYNTSNTTTANANYAPGETVTLTAASPTLTLYAIWQQDIQTIKTITNMQQMTTAICAASATGDTNTLTDTRDSSTYTVAKLSDGNCWMTSNLTLDLNNRTLTPDNSNVSSSWPSTTGASSKWNTDINSCRPATSNGCNITKFYNGSSTNGWNRTYGYYYTWRAAVAESGNDTTSNADAADSICPKGWVLPSKTVFDALLSKSGLSNSTAADALKTPFLYVLSGFYGDGWGGNEVINAGSNGTYWSSTGESTNGYSYYLNITSSTIETSSHSIDRGRSVRCVAEKPQEYTYSISYKFKNGHSLHSGTMPSDENITTTDTSHTFTVRSGPMVQVGTSWCGLKNWLGSDGIVYTPNSTVTLTPDQPSITLTTNATGTCAGS